MIGNDLVYLPNWKRRSGDRLSRFRQKIYTQRERNWIEAADDPFLLEAKFWAVKEAVYKSWFKKYRERIFKPKSISIEAFKVSEEEFVFQVEIGNLRFKSICRKDGNYIHATAIELNEDLEFSSLYESYQSAPRAINFKSQKITLQKDSSRVPYGLYKGRKLDVSMSHDGDLRAVVWRV
ncbi:4'-phosphopantetheinyl transferase family protein [Halocola ammonii]